MKITNRDLLEKVCSRQQDGKIYFISGLYRDEGVPALNAVNPDGSLDWRIENPDFIHFVSSRTGLSFSPDGKTLYVPGKGPSVFAVSFGR